MNDEPVHQDGIAVGIQRYGAEVNGRQTRRFPEQLRFESRVIVDEYSLTRKHVPDVVKR